MGRYRVENELNDKSNSRLRRSIALSFKSRFQRIDPTYESYTGLKAIDYATTVVVALVELYLSPEPGVVYDMYVNKV